jgi:hypothetical protein
MATRSTIALEFADGTVGQVYCHWDGYLEHNGKILQESYSNPFILRDLIDLGDLSSLAPMIGTKHDFDTRVEGICTFYGRDRGEDGVSARYFKNYQDYLDNAQREEYDYILRNVDGVAIWFVSDHGSDFKELSVALWEEVTV